MHPTRRQQCHVTLTWSQSQIYSTSSYTAVGSGGPPITYKRKWPTISDRKERDQGGLDGNWFSLRYQSKYIWPAHEWDPQCIQDGMGWVYQGPHKRLQHVNQMEGRNRILGHSSQWLGGYTNWQHKERQRFAYGRWFSHNDQGQESRGMLHLWN